MSHLLILPSPFLGPRPYEPLADALGDRGVAASVATYDEPPVATELVEQWVDQAGRHDDVVLVAHSNAGYLAPAVARRAGRLPILFVDAALPVATGETPLAPSGFRELLEVLADEHGLLPRWTRWWPREDVEATLPDRWFDRLDAQLPRVPLAYVDARVPVPDDWEQRRCGYLAFGSDTYVAELARARALDWPARVVQGAGHLHCLIEPDATALAVLGLLSTLLR